MWVLLNDMKLNK